MGCPGGRWPAVVQTRGACWLRPVPPFTVAALSLVAACGDAPFDPEAVDGTITASMTSELTAAAPGARFRVDVQGVPPSGGRLSRLVVFVRFAELLDSLEAPVRYGGAVNEILMVQVPRVAIEGTLKLVARADMQDRSGYSDTLRITIGDDEPPVPSWTDSVPARIGADTSLTLRFRATDNGGIVRARLEVSGAVAQVEERQYGAFPQLGDQFVLTIPAKLDYGAQVHVRLSVVDLLGNIAILEHDLRVDDLILPWLTAELAAGRVPGVWSMLPVFAAGDTLDVAVWAADNNRLAWVGARVSDMAGTSDSVAVAGDTTAQVVHLRVQPTALQPQAPIEVFARDSSGNERLLTRRAMLVNARVPETRILAVPSIIGLVAVHPDDGVAYLANPDSQRVEVLRLDPLARLTPVALGNVPFGLDLTPEGDSLVVAASGALIWVDVSNPDAAAVAVTVPQSIGARTPRLVVVDSTGRVASVLASTGATDSLLGVVDRTTRTLTLLATPYPIEVLGVDRAGDRGRAVTRWGQVLHAGEDTVRTLPALPPLGAMDVSRTGFRILVGASLYDGSSHAWVRDLLPQQPGFTFAAWGTFGQDDTSALVAAYDSPVLSVVNTSTGTLMDALFLPFAATGAYWVALRSSVLVVAYGRVALLTVP